VARTMSLIMTLHSELLKICFIAVALMMVNAN
jgi:hypothetical protein